MPDAFTATPSGGTTPYTYAWTIGGTGAGSAPTLVHTFTSAGGDVVQVTVTDANGNAASATVDETVNALPTATLSAQYNPVDAGVSDLFTASASGGSGTITYAWTLNGGAYSGTSSTNTHTASSTGSYSFAVEVTDALGQADNVSVTVTVQVAPSVTTSGPSATDVSTETGWSGSATFGSTPYTYSWKVNGAVEGTSSSFTYAFGTTGSFTLNLTVTDAEGAHAYWQETVTVNALPSASASESAPSADVGTTVTFSSAVTGGTSPFTYAWTVNGASEGSASTLAWSASSTGIYSISVRVTDAAGQQSTSSAIDFTANALPSASASAAYTTIDQGIADTLTGTAAAGTSPYTYAWSLSGSSIGAGSPFSWSAPGAARSYTLNLTVRDADGDTATASVTVTVVALPASSESVNRTAISVGVPAQFTDAASGGVGPYSYAWTKNGTSIGTTNPIGYTFTAAGWYWINVTATDAFGLTAKASLYVHAVSGPSATIVRSASATDVGLAISFSMSVTGGLSPYTETWEVNGVAVGSSTTLDYTFSATGSYTVTLIVKDSAGLTSSPTASITVNPSLTATMSAGYLDADVETSDSFTLAPSVGTAPYSYGWTVNGTAQSSTSATLSYFLAGPGIYTVTGTVTDAAGEAVTDTDEVTVQPPIGASITAAYLPVDVGVNDSLRPIVSGGVGPYTYSWLVQGDVYTTQYHTAVFASTGISEVELTVSDSFGRDATVYLNITVYADPTVTVSLASPPALVSQTSTYTAAPTNGYGPFTYLWTFPGGQHETTATASVIWQTAGAEPYQLYYSDAGGYNTTLSLTANVHLDVTATANVTRGPAELSVLFSASALGASSYSFTWNFGNGQQSSLTDVGETFAAGNWTVELSVTSPSGGVGWANITIVSLPSPASVTVAPSSDITVLTVVMLTATPSWVASAPEYANWTLPNGTVLHGLTVTLKFPTYSATKSVTLRFTYGANGTEWTDTFLVGMTRATPTAAATGVSTLIPPGTLLTVSGAPSTSPDASIAAWNWTLSGLLYRGETQSFYLNTTGSFNLILTVTDALGAEASTNWTIHVEALGSNATVVIGISSVSGSNSITYTVSVHTPNGIAATDAFADGQLLILTLVNDSLTGSLVTSANYSLAINLGAYAAGTYTFRVVAYNQAGQSNSASTTFTDSLSGSSGGTFDIVAAVGGTANFWIIIATIIGTIATVYGVTRRSTVNIDVDGTQLRGRKGKPLVVESLPKRGKGGSR